MVLTTIEEEESEINKQNVKLSASKQNIESCKVRRGRAFVMAIIAWEEEQEV